MPRKTGKIQSNKTILLIVEGETEQIYFSEMKSVERIPGITIIPKMASHSSVYHILKMALTEYDSLVYDSIWCVFDYDTLLADGITPEVQKQFDEARRKGIQFADSLPSFEVWYLLHYGMPKKQYQNQDELLRELKRHIANYSKNIQWLEKARLYTLLKPEHLATMDNSKKLAARNEKDTNEGNTFCNVYKVFEEIEENVKN